MATILIADGDPGTRQDLEELLRGQHLLLETADGSSALEILQRGDPAVDLVVADLHLPGVGGMDLLETARARRPNTEVILTAAFGSVEDAVHALHLGAADFLCKPFSHDQARLAVERTLEKASLLRENRDLRAALDDRQRSDDIVVADPRSQGILKIVRAVAPSRTTVLLTGESGTGKTLLARMVHHLSPRRSAPFVEVNCGALPENLLETELFGHVKGAFTGATRDRAGKFEAAHGGTIFLDEIGTSSPSFQVRLLRVLQDRVVERIGANKLKPIDVRVVLATNLDLAKEVEDGSFREDLYYRINVVTIEVPPLRERTGDIPMLAQRSLQRIAAENERPIEGFTSAAMELLCRAPWPGNVRQLENVVERAVVLAEGHRIGVQDLPRDIGARGSTRDPDRELPADLHLMPLREALEIPEQQILARALEHHGGNRQATARSLGINRSTLFNKMRKYGLH